VNQNSLPKKFANPGDHKYRVWLLQQKRKKRSKANEPEPEE
jgi:hypothetical protein